MLDLINKMKSVLLGVVVVGCLPLCAMEKELQKTEDSCVVKKALFCAEIMKQYDVPQEIASVVACNNYLLRKVEVYQKFDSFFHFDNDNYGVMKEKHSRDKKAFINENWGHLGNHDLERFNKQYPYNFDLCRKCDVIAPHDLFFLTEKQDTILLTLIFLPKRFLHTKGTMILQFDKKEHEQYVTLPAALLKLLNKYQMNIIDKWAVSSGGPDPEVLCNNYSGSFMNDF
jgi:hypothetical protein